MDGRRNQSTGSADEGMALVKAAAWAWYQHGSGNEGRTAPESDLARPGNLQPRPSRFKLEAAAAAAAAIASVNESAAGDLLSASSLTQRSRTLRAVCAENSPPERCNKVEGVAGHPGGGSLYGVPRVARGRGSRKQGFWVRHAVGFCGSRAEVAEGRARVGGRRPQLRLGP